jgi:hypothetical protein
MEEAMKFKDRLTQIQTQAQCEHVNTLGVPCDTISGGWWTCTCAVAADKMETAERAKLANPTLDLAKRFADYHEGDESYY